MVFCRLILMGGIRIEVHRRGSHHSCSAYRIHRRAAKDKVRSDKRNQERCPAAVVLFLKSRLSRGHIFFAVKLGWHSYFDTPFKSQICKCFFGTKTNLQIGLFVAQTVNGFFFINQTVKKQFNRVKYFIICDTADNNIIISGIPFGTAV